LADTFNGLPPVLSGLSRVLCCLSKHEYDGGTHGTHDEPNPPTDKEADESRWSGLTRARCKTQGTADGHTNYCHTDRAKDHANDEHPFRDANDKAPKITHVCPPFSGSRHFGRSITELQAYWVTTSRYMRYHP